MQERDDMTLFLLLGDDVPNEVLEMMGSPVVIEKVGMYTIYGTLHGVSKSLALITNYVEHHMKRWTTFSSNGAVFVTPTVRIRRMTSAEKRMVNACTATRRFSSFRGRIKISTTA